MVLHGIEIPEEGIADFCRRNHIRKLALFGSILTDDFGPRSDVDVLVEFEPDPPLGLFGFVGLQEELTSILGRPVDLSAPDDTTRRFWPRVLAEAVTIYAR
jgi:predicted nucleotidyltransferase